MNKMREEFEIYCVTFKDEFGLFMPVVKDSDGEYLSEMTCRAWQAWQASRKALVVELPVAFPVCDDKDSAEVYFADDTHKALDAAGVSYK